MDGEFSVKQWELVFKSICRPLLGCRLSHLCGSRQAHEECCGDHDFCNGVVSKKGSVAYDSSKSAANHIVRELAVELAPYARVYAVAPATVMKGSLMFPRDRVMASLAKYAIAYSEESTGLASEIGKILR